jgi:hypothetical protein
VSVCHRSLRYAHLGYVQREPNTDLLIDPPLDGDEDLQSTLDICIPHAVNDYILNKLPGEVLTDKEEVIISNHPNPK